ncbi:MAG: Lrp/AsnC family transcriptional regulator [Rhodobacteraceae bacterium]|nr:Lrp/AsnC family transcriptional regulator [Paracoccaceae bacterium]
MSPDTKLDRIDIKILAELQANGRITNAALASAVGLSQSPCLQRLKRLETNGYVRGYGARIDIGKLADAITVFTEITLADHSREDFANFETGIERFPEVLECHLVSGGYDYLVKFVTRSVSDYQTTIERVLDARIGIDKYFSYIVIKSPIVGRDPPIERLLKLE